jgi:clan AA aspartic protease (TIGR02281 family)
LNDRVTATFYVDTGASNVSIPAAVADELGIQLGPDTQYVDVTTANGVVAVPVITLDSVETGEARVEQVRAGINSSLDVGLLGGAFFNNFTFQIDPAAQVITAVRNDRVRAGDSEAQWRQRFQRIRNDIATLDRYMEENHFTSPSRIAQLEASRAELERRLEELDEKADRADVPHAWRE